MRDMKVMLLTAASALSRFNGVLRSGYSRDQWWWREIARPGFFNPGRLVGKFSQLTSLFNFVAVNRQGCLFDGSLEHTSDFLQQAFFFPIPLQAVLRAALRVFYFRIDFRLSGDHGRQQRFFFAVPDAEETGGCNGASRRQFDGQMQALGIVVDDMRQYAFVLRECAFALIREG